MSMDNKDVTSMKQRRGLSVRKVALLSICSCLLILSASLALASSGGIQKARADSAFSQGVQSVSSSQALFWFQPGGWTAGYVILHYTVASQAQQNVNMSYNSGTGRWEYTVGGLSPGQTISYAFTYQQNGLQYDTGSFTSTVGAGGNGPFATSFESGQPQPTWTNTVDNAGQPAGGLANVGGICCNLSGPELGTRTEVAHSGSTALMYSGLDTSATSSYAYLEVFDFSGQNLTVGSTTTLTYWIYAESPSGSAPGANLTSGINSSCVALDLIFSDGTNLRDSGATDQHGNRVHPAAQCGHLTMDAWNQVIVNLGAFVSGKTILRLDMGYDQPANTGGYRGYIDDISIGSSSVTPTPTPTATSTPSTGPAGTFPLILQNNTNGTWSNSQVYITVLGQATPGQWYYMQADGTLVHINSQDASAPNHLTKNGVNYANMSFTMAQASIVTMPTQLQGARIYISLGSPMYFPIASDNSGWGGPNLFNPNDPNADVYFDWYEFTYAYGTTPFGGNTTQVDMFGIPLTAHVQQTASGFDQTNGTTLTRNQVYAQYAASVSAPFQGLASTYRIVAPKSSATFLPGGSQANYLQAYIDQTWSYYTNNQFTLTRGGVTFTGRVVNGQLQFTRNSAGPFVLNKPTTADVFACAGALASSGMTSEELELGAEFCAAFNRGVALNTGDWENPAAYYTGSTKDDYAMFWHQICINNKAYGFAYDDVNNQSSVAILPNANPPTALTLGIGW